MQKETKTLIAFLGGTFDPIHKGHLNIAKQLCQQLPINELHFMPSHQPPHKETPKATAAERLAMIQLALNDHPQFKIEICELRRAGVSYSIDTVKYLRKILPKASLALIIGIDSFNQFDAWREWREILNYAHLIVVNRPDYTYQLSSPLKEFMTQHLANQPTQLLDQSSGLILPVTTSVSPISATNIRHQIAQGQSPPYKALSPAVWHYIQTHHLYQAAKA